MLAAVSLLAPPDFCSSCGSAFGGELSSALDALGVSSVEAASVFPKTSSRIFTPSFVVLSSSFVSFSAALSLSFYAGASYFLSAALSAILESSVVAAAGVSALSFFSDESATYSPASFASSVSSFLFLFLFLRPI